MAKAKSEKEVRIKLKKKTAENIIELNDQVSVKLAEFKEAQVRLQNHVLPILTEHDILDGRVVEVTEKEPFELVLMVPV
jgi:SOS response regulatory protein OraA/RecX